MKFQPQHRANQYTMNIGNSLNNRRPETQIIMSAIRLRQQDNILRIGCSKQITNQYVSEQNIRENTDNNEL